MVGRVRMMKAAAGSVCPSPRPKYPETNLCPLTLAGPLPIVGTQ